MFHFTTLFIGVDVHKESFSLCYYDMMANQVKHPITVEANVTYIVNYIQELRRLYGEKAEVLCGLPCITSSQLKGFLVLSWHQQL
nr:hypothetical protein [Streptococcus sp. S784/96/1]